MAQESSLQRAREGKGMEKEFRVSQPRERATEQKAHAGGDLGG